MRLFILGQVGGHGARLEYGMSFFMVQDMLSVVSPNRHRGGSELYQDGVEVLFIVSKGSLSVVSPNRHHDNSELYQDRVKVGNVSLHSQGKWLGRRCQTGSYRYRLLGLLGPGCECRFYNL